MAEITRRALGALGFAGIAAQAYAKTPAPAVKPAWPDATETAAMIRDKRLSASEAAKTAIERAERLQPKLNFLVASDFDRALDRGALADHPGPFGGVPFLIKDLDDYTGLPSRSGSRAMLAMPPATHHSRLISAYNDAGLNVIGKSSTPEYGFLPTTEPVGFGPTRNPWDPSRSSGGSSGGAAVATAAGVVPFAHASDGGGSIRIPASCCGLFGLKPSRGRMVGTRGETQVTQIGVEHALTRSVRDSAALFALTEDPGPGGQFTPVGLITEPLAKKTRLRVGLLIPGGAGKAPTAEVLAATESSARLMADLGHKVTPTTWPISPTFINDFLLLWANGAADLAGTLAKVMGHRPGPDTLEAFSLGMVQMFEKAPKDALPATLGRLQAATLAYNAWFETFDVILSPVLSSPPPLLGYVGPDVPFDTLIERLIEYVGYTTIHNVAGAPAMSVPLNWTPSGLPVGTMFAAKAGNEALLFQLAYQLELARPWSDKVPPIRV